MARGGGVQRRIARIVAGQRHQQRQAEQTQRQPAQFRRPPDASARGWWARRCGELHGVGPDACHAIPDRLRALFACRHNYTPEPTDTRRRTQRLAARVALAPLSRRMSDTLSAEVCVVGAGPVGGTLACRLAAAGIATVVVDRAALPPMEHPAFDGRAYAIAAGSRRPAAGGRSVGPLARAALPDPRYPRQRRPPWPPRLAAVPAFRPPRGRRRCRPVRLDGGSAQPAHGAERAHARRCRRCACSLPPTPRWSAARTAPRCASPAARTSTAAWWSPPRAATRRCARPPTFRSPRCRTARPASSARSATRSRTTTRRWSISCRPGRSRNCR